MLNSLLFFYIVVYQTYLGDRLRCWDVWDQGIGGEDGGVRGLARQAVHVLLQPLQGRGQLRVRVEIFPKESLGPGQLSPVSLLLRFLSVSTAIKLLRR